MGERQHMGCRGSRLRDPELVLDSVHLQTNGYVLLPEDIISARMHMVSIIFLIVLHFFALS